MLCNAMEHKQQLSHQTARAGMDDLADSTTTTAYIGSLKQQNQGYSRIAQKQSNKIKLNILCPKKYLDT